MAIVGGVLWTFLMTAMKNGQLIGSDNSCELNHKHCLYYSHLNDTYDF